MSPNVFIFIALIVPFYLLLRRAGIVAYKREFDGHTFLVYKGLYSGIGYHPFCEDGLWMSPNDSIEDCFFRLQEHYIEEKASCTP